GRRATGGHRRHDRRAAAPAGRTGRSRRHARQPQGLRHQRRTEERPGGPADDPSLAGRSHRSAAPARLRRIEAPRATQVALFICLSCSNISKQGITMRRLILVCCALLTLVGCQSAYYSAMEKAGIHKRDILVDRVEDARDSQQEAKEQFKDALERYRSVVEVKGGDLEKRYDALNHEYEASVASARDVQNRIEAVEDVAEALFKEWEAELKQYSNAGLKAASAKELSRTRSEYRTLIQRMKAAEKSIEPVLSVLGDQVLFLKHNLNARAISALHGEYRSLQSNVDQLLADMQRAIDEADTFIRRLQAEG